MPSGHSYYTTVLLRIDKSFSTLTVRGLGGGSALETGVVRRYGVSILSFEFLILNSHPPAPTSVFCFEFLVFNYSPPAAAMTHRRQRVAHGLLPFFFLSGTVGRPGKPCDSWSLSGITKPGRLAAKRRHTHSLGREPQEIERTIIPSREAATDSFVAIGTLVESPTFLCSYPTSELCGRIASRESLGLHDMRSMRPILSRKDEP